MRRLVGLLCRRHPGYYAWRMGSLWLIVLAVVLVVGAWLFGVCLVVVASRADDESQRCREDRVRQWQREQAPYDNGEDLQIAPLLSATVAASDYYPPGLSDSEQPASKETLSQ